MTFRSLLLTSATVISLTPALAYAAPTPIGETTPLTQQVPIVQGPDDVRQIRFDDGTIVSFVGAARYTITGPNSISIDSGDVTILSGSPNFSVTTANGSITVNGGTALKISGGNTTSHVFNGTVSVRIGSQTQSFRTGEAWSSNGRLAVREFAAGPQAVPGVEDLQLGGIAAAAFNGLPVALGEALAALGASSDVVVAWQSFDAVVQGGLNEQSLQSLPADFNQLLAFQNAIAARLSSDEIFAGASPAILDAYLRYLAGGGRIAEFQALYANLLGAYFEVLQQGGFPSDFQGLSAADVQAYLDYLNAVGGVSVLGAAQQDLVSEYLTFLAEGGVPSNFIFSGVTLDAATIDLYFGFLSDFVAFIRSGGVPSDFTGLDQTILARYIQLLANAGQLEALFGLQADIFEVYAEFIVGGGNPNEFPGLNDFGLSAELIAEFTSNLQLFLASLFNGATISDFGVDATVLARQIAQLENEGVLAELFAVQRAILLEFAAFIEEGGAANDFTGFAAFGFSDAVVQAYKAAINQLLTFVAGAGDLADFTGSLDELIRFITDLNLAGQLSAVFTAEQQAVLLEFVAFVEAGGDPADFEGFIALGFSDAIVQSYVEAITQFLDFVIEGGEISAFDGDLDAVLAFIADLEAAGQLQAAFNTNVYDALLAFLTFVTDGGDPDDFTGFEGLETGGGSGGADVIPGSFNEGPDVVTVSEIDANAAVEFDFASSTGYSVIDLGADRGNRRFNSRRVSFARLGSFRDDDGLPSREPFFTLNDLDLTASGRFGDVLLTRHVGPGSAAIGGKGVQFDGTVALDTAFVQNASQGLPTSGEVIFDLTETLGVQTLGYEGDASVDMVLGVRFGTLPLVAANAILRADTDYIYATAGDGVSGLDFTNGSARLNGPELRVFMPLVSGQGAFCGGADANCSMFALLVPNADYTQLGGTLITGSFLDEDATAAAAVGLTARDASSVITEIPDVMPGGMVTAPFGTDRANLLTVEAGAANRTLIQLLSYPRTALAFDEQGLSVINRGLSNAFARGEGVVTDLAGDADWQIGRWVGLVSSGTIFSQNSGLSYAIVPLMDGIPGNGRVDYTLLGSTSPVYGDSATAPGTFDAQAVLVLGALPLFGIDATVTMPDATYTFTTTGGLEDPSMQLGFSNQVLSGQISDPQSIMTTMEGDGHACPNGIESCQTQLLVNIGGNDAEYAAIGYAIYDASFESAGVSGSAVFGGALQLDGPTDPIAGDVRENQFIVYSANTIGIDNRYPTTVTYDETTGAPIAYQWLLNDFTSERERPSIGSASLAESGSVGDTIGWARWAGGTTGGRYYDLQTADLPENAGWHLVSGDIASNLPTSGTVSYDLVGNTSPTIRDGSLAPGTLDSAQAAVAFGTIPRVGVELGLTIGGESYSLSTIGGVSDLSQGLEVMTVEDTGQLASFRGDSFQNNLLASGGSLCSGSSDNCNATLTGFLSGEGASHIGVAYTLGNTTFDRQIDGSAVFAQSDSSASGTAKLGNEPIMSDSWARWSNGDLVGVSATDERLPNTVRISADGELMHQTGLMPPSWISFD